MDPKFMLPDALKEKVEELETRISALNDEAKPLREQLGNIDRQKSKLATERNQYVERIKELKEKPRVSDHAVIRYLERKYGFTFEDIRTELLTPTVVSAMNSGVESVKVNGTTLKIKGRTVVTVLN
jgi:predicted nuclease with TOPRIM domain